jgi:glycosyltransferase involved in cell wall biosynthesis
MYKHFDYHPEYFGGTEYMGRGFEKHILPYMPKLDNYLALILPGLVPILEDLMSSNKQILLWMHNTPHQFSLNSNSSQPSFYEVITNPVFINKLKYLIVISEEQKRLTLLDVKIDPDKVYVIPNAIDPILPAPKPNKIKIIHTSTASRGMNVLLDSLKYIKDDFVLEVYNDFYPDIEPNFVADPRVKFFGKTPKATVHEAISTSHIHAYPSTYPETFCLSQVEAMSAGLLCVTSNLGALPEVSGGHTIMYKHTYNDFEHSKIFAKHLQEAIDIVKSGSWDPSSQIEYVNATYSWDAIRDRWLELHEKI